LPFSEPGDQVAAMESQENQRHVWVGIAWMLLSGLCFVGVNGVVKHLGTDLPAAQSAFIRFAYGAVFFLPVLPGVWRMRLPAPVWRLFGWRGLLHVAAVVFWFHAMARVPVAEMSAIAFLNPVIVLVIAGLLLGERLGPRRVMVVLAALAGAMLVLRPGFREVSEGHLAQIAATLFFAASYVIAKRLAGLAPASVIVAVMSVSVTLGLLPLALATGGHYAMTRAFEAAPLAVTQPVTFLQIIWSAALGALAFGEPVDPWVIAGGAVIIGAVSVNSWRESRAGRVPPAEPVEA
jgi:drug/metabolite transporter (DMT)-like permease